ncbi:MAG: DASS family sodium-coupled anion symporter [Oscillospiraceae bacterium]|nr:DASS family sodium-coupled anion symporter [Oscillospiraceae bacterium]
MSSLANPEKNRLSTRNLILILITIVVYFVISSLPTQEGLTREGLKAIALMVCALIFWILDVMPIGVTALLFTVLQPIVGTVNPTAMASNFLPTTFFFSVACFLIGQAMLETGLGNRIVAGLLKISGKSPKKLLFLLMCATSLISFVIANLALSALMVPLLIKIFKANNMEPGKSNFAKSCLIGVPVAVSIGGVGTPAGSLPNYQVISLVQQISGDTITFGQWAMIGIPLAIILTPLAYLVIVAIFKPEVDALDTEALTDMSNLGKLTVKEWGFIIIFAALIASWFLTDIAMPISGMLATCLFFLPKLEILNGKSFNKAINWNILMLICGSTGLAMAIFQTGAAEWIATTVLAPFTTTSPIIMILMVVAFTVFMHVLIPVNPSMVSVFVPIVAVFAPLMGVPVWVLILPLGYAVNCAFILPLDSVFALTYSSGYYSMRDLAKVGIPLSIVWVIIGTAIMFFFI